MANQKYDELFKQVTSVFEKNGPDAAFSYIEDCIKKTPNSPEIYLISGEFYLEVGDIEGALKDFEKAIKINPNESQAYYDRGLLYARTGSDINKALNDFSKAIELDANYAEAYANRANMYLKLREPQKAIIDCTKAIELSQDNFEPYFNRGLAYANTGEFAKALEDYNKVIELSPENIEAYLKRGILSQQLGNASDAIHDYEKFLELDPNNKNAALARDALRDLRSGKDSSGGCYIATCVYGSYDCPEVWTLRNFRDNELSNSWLGRCFIRIYYAVSPKIVELFGNKKWFSWLWKPIINTIVRRLQNIGIDKKNLRHKGTNPSNSTFPEDRRGKLSGMENGK